MPRASFAKRGSIFSTAFGSGRVLHNCCWPELSGSIEHQEKSYDKSMSRSGPGSKYPVRYIVDGSPARETVNYLSAFLPQRVFTYERR